MKREGGLYGLNETYGFIPRTGQQQVHLRREFAASDTCHR